MQPHSAKSSSASAAASIKPAAAGWRGGYGVKLRTGVAALKYRGWRISEMAGQLVRLAAL